MILNELKYIAKDLTSVPKDLIHRFARVPGVRAIVRYERCSGCSACVRKSFCRFGAISIEDRKAVVDQNRCRGCGRCTHLCIKNAFSLELHQPAAVKKFLRAIDNSVSEIMR